VKRIPLANVGDEVSRICLGCMLMGTSTDKRTSHAMLDRFLAAGGDFLDTANCYAWWVGGANLSAMRARPPSASG
jgi:aryl-alcohol dehydrogenase-like predicted oxidoreductase